jgi:hypothetical protein
MTRTVTRLFDERAQAMNAVRELKSMGVPEDSISLVANNAAGAHDDDDDNETAEGAGKGATTGGLLGGSAGLLAGLGMLAIPGLGPVVAAGWLASTAVGAVAGAVAGGAAGGLLGALKDAGHSEEDAHVYAEGVRRGGSLVSVKAPDDMAAQVEQVLNSAGQDASMRGPAYRESGWSGFDPNGPAYTSDQIRQERIIRAPRSL